MATNVEVTKTGTENSMGVLRRFTKRVQGSGILPRVRSLRYKDRNLSPNTRKKRALKKINRRKEVDLLIKLGKMQEKTPGSK
jgi:ribosomal protein S21